jgi:hypothetical protein
MPTALIILKRDGFFSAADPQIFNVYSTNRTLLSPCILEQNCPSVVTTSFKRMCPKQGCFLVMHQIQDLILKRAKE